MPLILGMVLAWRLTGAFRWGVAALGMTGVVLVMLATYYAGEYWDYREDMLGMEQPPSRFAGGSLVVQRGLLPRRAPLIASLVSVALALGVALALQFLCRTGPWTVPFAAIGLLGGFFYSAWPVRWVGTGVGELWIGFCYGWLPVAVGYYLQVGRLAPLVHWLAAPIAFTIFNVILLNEFPDRVADAAAGKRNLLVRLGTQRGALLYGAMAVASWGAVLLSLGQGVPIQALWCYAPVFVLSVLLVGLVVGGRWRDPACLERLCGANLVVNLGTTATYVLTLLGWANG
ncbi:MAG: prenyltransferase [Anaerolineales bacterium]|nr:prenyltransferase [Anaerolineales bacterium]